MTRQHQRRLLASSRLLSKLTRDHERREAMYRRALKAVRRG